MKRATLAYHRYVHDAAIRLLRILGREVDGKGQPQARFRYAPSEHGEQEDRWIKPEFSRALRHGPHSFSCGTGLYHNVNSRDRKIEKDTASEYTLVFDFPHEAFARRRSLNRTQALEAARLLDQHLSMLEIFYRLFPGEVPGVGEE